MRRDTTTVLYVYGGIVRVSRSEGGLNAADTEKGHDLNWRKVRQYLRRVRDTLI